MVALVSAERCFKVHSKPDPESRQYVDYVDYVGSDKVTTLEIASILDGARNVVYAASKPQPRTSRGALIATDTPPLPHSTEIKSALSVDTPPPPPSLEEAPSKANTAPGGKSQQKKAPRTAHDSEIGPSWDLVAARFAFPEKSALIRTVQATKGLAPRGSPKSLTNPTGTAALLGRAISAARNHGPAV